MRFESLNVQNYFSFEDTSTLDCSFPVTILSGRNNSGKSSLLRAFVALRQTVSGSSSQFANELGGADALRFGRRGGEARVSFELAEAVHSRCITSPNPINSAHLVFGISEERGLTVSLDVNSSTGENSLAFGNFRTTGVTQGNVSLDLVALREQLVRTYYLRSERVLWQPTSQALGMSSLNSDCTNVLQVLHSLAAGNPRLFARIVKEARDVLPGLDDLRFPLGDGSGEIEGRVAETAFASDGLFFRWDEMAAGSRHIIALVTFLLSSEPHSLLLIEEPEAYVHPDASLHILRLCDQVASEENKQIIITTHSPLIMEVAADRMNLVLREPKTGKSTIRQPGTHEVRALQRRRIMRSYGTARFRPGDAPTAFLIVEGDDDEAVWGVWLHSRRLDEAGVVAFNGGGWQAAVHLALLLRHDTDAGERSQPFLLVVDSDGDPAQRKNAVIEMGLPESDFRVLSKTELEDYLLNAEAIAEVLGEEPQTVAQLIERAPHGKAGLNQVLAELPTSINKADRTLKVTIAMHIEPADEVSEVLDFFEAALNS